MQRIPSNRRITNPRSRFVVLSLYFIWWTNNNGNWLEPFARKVYLAAWKYQHTCQRCQHSGINIPKGMVRKNVILGFCFDRIRYCVENGSSSCGVTELLHCNGLMFWHRRAFLGWWRWRITSRGNRFSPSVFYQIWKVSKVIRYDFKTWPLSGKPRSLISPKAPFSRLLADSHWW